MKSRRYSYTLRILLAFSFLGSVAFASACSDNASTDDCPAGTSLVNGQCLRDRGGPGRGHPGEDDVEGRDVPGDQDVNEEVDPGDDASPDAVPDPDTVEHDTDGFDGTMPDVPVEPPGECERDGLPPTTLRGRVTIPAGTLPLPDVAVYVPVEGSLRDILPGAVCTPCGDELSGTPVALVNTDIQGNFELRNVPYGENITLVTEVGKWRRVAQINVERCATTEVSHDLTRLPRNQSEGSLPQFAVTTGGCDAMECLLRKIGISDSEFTPEADGGRVHLFHGSAGTRRYAQSLNNGATFTRARDWWSRLDNLMPYDIVVHSCECNEGTNAKPESATTAMRDFADRGGRLFLSHFHYTWMRRGPSDFQSVAEWDTGERAARSPTRATIDLSFPKARQLSDWMWVNGLVEREGEFEIRDVRTSVRTLNEQFASRWVWIRPECDPIIGSIFPALCPRPVAEQPQYISFNTPVEAPLFDQCGRVVHSDIHVSGGDRSSDGTRDGSGSEVRFPNGCTTTNFTEQEIALVFMLFDLARCIASDKF